MVVVGGEATSAGRPINGGAVRPRLPRRGASKSPIALQVVAQTTLASARQWCGSKGAYNRPSYPCYYCTYRGGLLRQGAVDKAKADDQRHAGERQHHHLKVRKAVVGKQRKIVHDMRPKDVPVISRSEPAEGSWWRPCNRGGPGRPTLRAVTGSLPIRVRFSKSRPAQRCSKPLRRPNPAATSGSPLRPLGRRKARSAAGPCWLAP